jgi:GT2 family glycosyltransferase
VIIPTLTAGKKLSECVCSLERQTLRDFDVVIVDNSGKHLARRAGVDRSGAAILEMRENVGFGAAINAGVCASRAPFIAALNDDAAAHPEWLAELVAAMEAQPDAGMCASQVRLAFGGQALGPDDVAECLDSAGMLISGDGASKQRGHLEPPGRFASPAEVLLPSGSAALYRRAMLEEIGGFDERFFLYCEDTDLGLRARWAGWKCLYVPGAVVDHHYSHTAGQASPLKAYYVERNRLFVILKNFPAGMLLRAPFYTAARYFWHAVSIINGRGSAARFQRDNQSSLGLAWIALRAHCAVFAHAAYLWRERRRIRRAAKIGAREFRRTLGEHWMSSRQVAAL